MFTQARSISQESLERLYTELDEFARYWWGAETDDCSLGELIEGGQMAEFAKAVLERWGQPTREGD